MKGIPMKTWEVRALLDNRKTVTRRVVKPRYCDGVFEMFGDELCEASPYKPPIDNGDGTTTRFVRQYIPCKPPYRPGDILYVRETWQHGFGGTYLYKASAGHDLFMTADGELVSDIPWRPSIHMPREAARIFLRVTDVQVERLQDVTEEDAIKEGCTAHGGNLALDEFEVVWHNTLKPTDRSIYGWAANPWVWVIEFERISREEAEDGLQRAD